MGNQHKAVATLKSHFGDPQDAIQANIDVLLTLNLILKNSKISELNNIHDKIENISRNLQPAEANSEHLGLISIAITKKTTQ